MAFFISLKMPYFTYILQSEKSGKFYTGATKELNLRILRHNKGSTPSTKSGRPWKLVYIEQFSSKIEALKREREIKKMKSRLYIEALIMHQKSENDHIPGNSSSI